MEKPINKIHSKAVEVESNWETFEFFKSNKEKSINKAIIISNTRFASFGRIVRKNKVKKMLSNIVKTLVDKEMKLKLVVRKLFKKKTYSRENIIYKNTNIKLYFSFIKK